MAGAWPYYDIFDECKTSDNCAIFVKYHFITASLAKSI